jgi:hypothetical protein
VSARLALASEALVQPRHTILVVDDAPLLRELGALFLARRSRDHGRERRGSSRRGAPQNPT